MKGKLKLIKLFFNSRPIINKLAINDDGVVFIAKKKDLENFHVKKLAVVLYNDEEFTTNDQVVFINESRWNIKPLKVINVYNNMFMGRDEFGNDNMYLVKNYKKVIFDLDDLNFNDTSKLLKKIKDNKTINI